MEQAPNRTSPIVGVSSTKPTITLEQGKYHCLLGWHILDAPDLDTWLTGFFLCIKLAGEKCSC